MVISVLLELGLRCIVKFHENELDFDLLFFGHSFDI